MNKKPSWMGLLKMGIVSTICALIVIARAMMEFEWEASLSKATETAVGLFRMRCGGNAVIQ